MAAVVGSLALAVGLVVRLSGALSGAEAGLLRAYREAGFGLEAGTTQPWWAVLVLMALVYGIAFLLLEVPGTERRVLLAVTILVLAAAASPVLALWGTFWSPIVAVVCGAWSAFCATLWARHHAMPCEGAHEIEAGNVIQIGDKKRRQG